MLKKLQQESTSDIIFAGTVCGLRSCRRPDDDSLELRRSQKNGRPDRLEYERQRQHYGFQLEYMASVQYYRNGIMERYCHQLDRWPSGQITFLLIVSRKSWVQVPGKILSTPISRNRDFWARKDFPGPSLSRCLSPCGGDRFSHVTNYPLCL